jgi:hypothetical protein
MVLSSDFNSSYAIKYSFHKATVCANDDTHRMNMDHVTPPFYELKFVTDD